MWVESWQMDSLIEESWLDIKSCFLKHRLDLHNGCWRLQGLEMESELIWTHLHASIGSNHDQASKVRFNVQ